MSSSQIELNRIDPMKYMALQSVFALRRILAQMIVRCDDVARREICGRAYCFLATLAVSSWSFLMFSVAEVLVSLLSALI